MKTKTIVPYCQVILVVGAWWLTSAGVAAETETQTGAIQALVYADKSKRLLKLHDNKLQISTDQAMNWQAIPLPTLKDDRRIRSVAVPVDGSDTVYVAGFGIGVQRSIDAGKSWTSLSTDLPSQNVLAFATHATLPKTLYAFISEDGIYRSEDAGENWKRMDKGPRNGMHQFVHSDMEGSMQTGWLFAAGPNLVLRSMDCFCGWRPTGELEADKVFHVTFNPQQSMEVMAATDKGIYVSTDGGEKWTLQSQASPVKTVLSYGPEGVIFALSADSVLYQSMDGGREWQKAPPTSSLSKQPNHLTRGKFVYDRYCAACHGTDGEGKANWEKPNELGELPAPPHDQTGHTWKHADAMLFGIVNNGWRDPFNKTKRLTMPTFKELLTAQQIRDVIRYLKTLWTPEQQRFQAQESLAKPFPATLSEESSQ